MRIPRRTAKLSPAAGSSVQSQREALAHTGRTSTPLVPGVAHKLGWSVEAHRLRIENGGAEHVRVPALQPGARVSDQRERGGVAFRESRSCRNPRAG